MARDEVKIGEPPAMGIAGAAILVALIDELINEQVVSRDGMQRILGVAGNLIGRQGTHGPFAEARAFVASLRDNLPLS